jgi:DNA replication protein DnaC
LALGQSGCGKTLMCSIIANWLLFVAKREVIYLTWTDFIGQLKRDMMGEKTNEVSTYLDKIKKVDVLFIDEMLKKYNDTDLKYLIEIINYRYTNDLKTIITSENVVEKLLDIDEATFSRMIEKCEGFSVSIPKDRKKNFRLKGLRRDER